jgi:hypothetical protein
MMGTFHNYLGSQAIITKLINLDNYTGEAAQNPAFSPVRSLLSRGVVKRKNSSLNGGDSQAEDMAKVMATCQDRLKSVV